MRKKTIIIFIFAYVAYVIIIIVLFVLLLLRNQRPYNPIERNKIIFKVPQKDVQDSIYVMISFLKKFPIYKDDWACYFISDSNELFINYKKVKKIKDLYLENKNGNLDFLLDNEIIRFLNLVVFLNKNYLNSCDYFKNSNYIEFIYRDYIVEGDHNSDLLRFVTLLSSNNILDSNRYQILDRKGNLILYTFKNSLIWEGE